MSAHHPGIYLPAALCISTAFITAASAPGCARPDDQSPGIVQVTWGLEGTTCLDSGVDTVEVLLRRGNVTWDRQVSDCAAPWIEFMDLPAGPYHVQVRAFRPGNEHASYVGNANDVVVTPGKVSAPETIDLTGAAGGLDLTWRFESGALCQFSDVDKLEIVVWDSESRRVYEGLTTCSGGETGADPARTRAIEEDPIGLYVGGLQPGQYHVLALGYPDDAAAFEAPSASYRAEAHPVVQASRLEPVSLVLSECIEPGCE